MWRVERPDWKVGISHRKMRSASKSRFSRALVLALAVVSASAAANLHAQGLNDSSAANQGADAIVSDLSLTARILGGGNAEVGEWPSMVAIVISGNFPLEDRFFCGGTVVAERWIMTAAHCMFDPFGTATQADSIRVVAGINDLQDENAVETLVTNIFIHPQYDSNGSTLQNDIALLELGTALSAPATVLFDGDPETYNDTMAFIAGWGATTTDSSSSSQYPTLLQDASVPLVPLAQCNLPESYQGTIASTQVCAGFRQGGIDSCVGDSGGPLYIVENGQQVQVGITSFGNGCGLANFYGVYTNVSAFRPWMSNYIDVTNTGNEDTDNNEDTGNQDNNTGSGNGSDTGAAGSGSENSGTTDGTITVGGRRKGGSMNLGWLGVLGAIAWIRRPRKPLQLRFKNKHGHSVRVLLAGTFVTLSACSTYQPVAPTDNSVLATQNDAEVSQTMRMGENLQRLNLASMEGKPGLNALLLGSKRDELDQHLSDAGFGLPECTAEKTALEGTGRLFLREYCDVKPLSVSSLEGLNLNSLSVQFIDNQLVRIDAHLESGAAMALSKQLNAQYEHTPSSSRPFEWRLAENHIRLISDPSSKAEEVSGVLLQMIDGRLNDKLPALFAYL